MSIEIADAITRHSPVGERITETRRVLAELQERLGVQVHARPVVRQLSGNVVSQWIEAEIVLIPQEGF